MKSLSQTLLSLCSVLCVSVIPISTYAATSDPVGAMTVTVLNNSDTTLSLPFHKAPVFQGSISSSTADSISVSSSSWVADSFSSHYILLTDGSLAGFVAEITSNSETSLTCSGSIEDLSSLPVGTAFQVIPYTTIGDIVPADGPDNIYAFLYESGVGQNLAPSSILRHYSGFGWYSGASDLSDYPIRPSSSLVLRNQSGSDYDLTFYGTVLMTNQRAYLSTEAGDTVQDNRIGLSTPVDIALSEANIGYEGDYLFLYDNNAAVLNKAPSRILRYYDGFGWYEGATKVDDPADQANLVILKAGEGVVYRKAASSTPAFFEWNFLPSYLQQ